MIILGIMAWHKVGRLFHVSTFYIILPSPLISNLVGLSPLVLQNRYAPDSLYHNLSNLHDEGRPSDALEILQIVLEDSKQKQRQKEWQCNADVEINMDAKSVSGSMEWPEVSSTNVSFSAHVPLPPSTTASPFPAPSSDTTQPVPQQKQKMQLRIGGQSNLSNGMGATRGLLSANYQPVAETNISSDLTVGRKYLETSLSTSTTLANGTGVSAKMTRQYEMKKEGKLAFGFSSHRSLNVIHGRPLHAMFAFGMSSDLKLQYSVMSLTTWLDALHKPRITAKMSLGTQFPLECSFHLKKMHRAGRMSVAWSPLQGYKLKGMINRDLISKSSGLRKRFASNLGIGVEHTGLSGLKWLIQYQRPDGLTVRVPIFLQSFLSPGYWNRVVFVTTLSYLVDETVEEWLGISSEVAETTSDTSTIQKIRTNEKEMQWLSTPQAKGGARQQLSIIASVAKTKRQREEATNGLVILKATYSYAYASLSAPAISPKLLSEDVTQQLQFYVDNSRLCLPASSKSLLLGFYNLRIGYGTNIGTTNIPDFPPLSKFIDRFISSMNHGLSFLGLGGKVVPQQSLQKDRSAILTVRYKFQSRVFEISVADKEKLGLPSNDAVDMGASDYVC